MAKAAVLLVLWLLPLAVPVRAEAPEVGSSVEQAREAYALSRELMSPYCPGRTLADCPSPDAAALRQEIRTLVASGVGKEQIVERLRARFGEGIEGGPRSVWGWAVPVVILCLGALLLVWGLRSLSRREPREGMPPLAPELEAEIDRELES